MKKMPPNTTFAHTAKLLVKACCTLATATFTHAQFVPAVGTAGNDTITGSGTFIGSLDATQGGFDTITVAPGTVIINDGLSPNLAIIDAGLGIITVNSGSTFTSAAAGQSGIIASSTASSAGNQSSTITSGAAIVADSFAIVGGVANLGLGGTASLSITNSGNLVSINGSGIDLEVGADAVASGVVNNSGSITSADSSISLYAYSNAAGNTASLNVQNSGALTSITDRGIEAETNALGTGTGVATINITNSGAITSDQESIYTDAAAIANATDTASVTINNTANLTSINSQGIEVNVDGVASATALVTNSGNITTSSASIEIQTDATALTGGASSVVLENSGNLTSTGDSGIEAFADGVFSAGVQIANSGNITSQLDGIHSFANANFGFGNATMIVNNTGVINSSNGRGIIIGSLGDVAATTTLANSGNINSFDTGILVGADATFGLPGVASVFIQNSGDITVSNVGQRGIHALANGVNLAYIVAQNSGDISSDGASVYLTCAALVPPGGNSQVVFNNSGNLTSANDNGIESQTAGVLSAINQITNSGDILASARGILSLVTGSGPTSTAAGVINNSGSIVSVFNLGIEQNVLSSGDASGQVVNSGSITATGAGTFGIWNLVTSTAAQATANVTNSGQINANSGIRSTAIGELGANSAVSNSGAVTSVLRGIDARADSIGATLVTNSVASVINSGQVNSTTAEAIYARARANYDALTQITNTGTAIGTTYGLRAEVHGDVDGDTFGVGRINVFNSGTVRGDSLAGIFVEGTNSPTAEIINRFGKIFSAAGEGILVDGSIGANRTYLIGGEVDAGNLVFAGNGQSELFVLANPNLNRGMMDGGGGTSRIRFNLVGMTPKEARRARAQMGNSAGSFTISGGKLEYNWQNFDGGSSGTFISLQMKVDKSLVPTAKWLDRNAIIAYKNADIAAFYDKAGRNPGKEIANLMGQAEALARNDVLLEYSNLLAYMTFNMGHDFAAGYAARSFDISMVNILRPDVLMAGNTMMNRLNRMSDMPSRAQRTAPLSNPSPWSVWLGGNALMATQDKWEDRAGYDNLTGNPMVGVNYRPSANTLLGLMAGATITELDFTNNSRLEGLGGLFGLHATQRFADLYTSAFFGGGITGFEQTRKIMGRTARADFDSSMITGGGNVGYGFKFGNLTAAPEAGLVYTHLMHDGYRERGAGVFNRTVGSSDVDSLKTRLGGRLSYLAEMADWVFAPFIHASWAHEFLYDNNEAPVKLPRFGMPSFDIGNDNPERDSALVGAGMSFKFNKLSQLSAYIGYEANIGFTRYMSHTGSLGLRWDF